jgi:hypothetical protein
MACIHDDPFSPARRLALVASLGFGAFALSVSAQGFPGGGMGRGGGHMGGERSIVRGADGKPGEAMLRPHVLALFAAGLEKESIAAGLPAPAAQALRELIRELKDFAALDDRHVRERMGWTRGTVHAVTDLQRDLADTEESAHETAAAAADVMARWKALRDQLDESQRDRIETIYRNALTDSAAPAARTPPQAR